MSGLAWFQLGFDVFLWVCLIGLVGKIKQILRRLEAVEASASPFSGNPMQEALANVAALPAGDGEVVFVEAPHQPTRRARARRLP